MSGEDPQLQKLYNYYRMLSPNIDLSTGAVKLIATGQSQQTSETNTTGKVYKNYITSAVSGENLVEDKELKEAATGGAEKKVKGLFFNTVFQTINDDTSKFLDSDYWATPQHAASVKGAGATKPQKEESSYNFLFEVCKIGGKPPVKFAVNVLRSPLLTKSRRNVDEIQTFLNHIPSIFASRMVPYLDVEFQLPYADTEGKGVQQNYLNKPSLLRFLLGSVEIPKSLTEADKSLITLTKTGTSKDPNTASSFVGMEMFTTPQTLTNMDELGPDASRVNNVKPFLPPATLVGASIQVQNAGAGMFTHKTANLDFKIHDKNRLTEFSEFIRGPAGYSNVTVWLTYGWLAPRSDTVDDVYAKFINNTMLVREAYMVKNAGFTFDTTGQVSIKVELVSKSIGPIQTYTLDKGAVFGELGDGSGLRAEAQKINDRIKIVNEGSAVFGEPPEGMKDLRFYQILSSAGAGQLDLDIKYDVLKAQIAKAKDNISKKSSKTGKPIFTDSEKKQAEQVLNAILELYDPKNVEAYRKASIDYVNKRLMGCIESKGNKDPFLPIAAKKDFHSEELIAQCNNAIPYTIPAAPAKTATDGTTKKAPEFLITSATKVVSLGKLFSVFCLPSILACAKEQDIDEVQINFYQLNESCGPLSYANVAEFPIDLNLFYTQFQGFIERRGGESMTLQDFMQFVITNQVMDNRAIGYGMKDFYEPYTPDNITDLKQVKDFDTKMAEWISTYKSLKQPNIVIYVETIPINDDPSATNNVDLLQKIGSTVGSYYNVARTGANNDVTPKKMLKIHIYDKSFDPYAIKAQTILRLNDGFATLSDEELQKLIEKIAASPAATGANNIQQIRSLLDQYGLKATTVNSEKKGSSNAVSRNVLRDFVGETVPTITYGTNSSLITNATLASKTDGLLGTINLLGGSQKSTAALSENGLSQAANMLPMRIVPAQLTMTSLGCPIAEPYQSFFVDFGTGTTIDNLYAATQVSHTFSPGKFETNWTFAYTDGYGKFYSASSLKDIVDSLAKAT